MSESPKNAYENKELTRLYDHLIRKIDDTRRSRFHMAKRLQMETVVKKYGRDERIKRITGYASGGVIALLIILYPMLASLFRIIFP